MCKCTPEIRTPFCGRGDCLPPASREPTETLFAQSVLAEFDRRDQAERLDAWERGLDQYAHRSDSSGYAGRMGLEVLTELRLTRAQADALADALRNQGLLQNTYHGKVWHVHDCPASFDFAECNYRCRVAREAFALAGTEPYVSQETRRDTEVYE